jgi:hypothetical protein
LEVFFRLGWIDRKQGVGAGKIIPVPNGKAPVQRGLKPGASWNAPMGPIAGTGTERHTTEIVPAGSRAGYPTRPFFRGHEIRLKRRCTPMVPDQTMESVMLDIIIRLFYRQSCKASLSAIRFQKHLWD